MSTTVNFNALTLRESAGVTFNNTLVPSTSNAYDLGSANLPFRNAFVGGNVGIGTWNMVSPLHVEGASLLRGTVTTSNNYVDIGQGNLIGEAFLEKAPYLRFNGTALVRDTFLSWMQWVTSDRWRSGYNTPSNWWSGWSAGEVGVGGVG